MSNSSIREPAVAGLFYPADPACLRADIAALLQARERQNINALKALIVPHAGYIYSGATAAAAYAQIAPLRARIRRVVLLGPSHRVALRGMALPTHQQFQTPLGAVNIDPQAAALLGSFEQVAVRDDAHRDEHSLEVHLPFLQMVLDDFVLIPIVVGLATPSDVAKVLDTLWGGTETLIVISSDLSHFHSYAEAETIDAHTAAMISQFDYANIRGEDACGYHPLNGLLKLAQQRHMSIELLDLRNSGDTAGTRDRVVGYGAWALAESEGSQRTHG